jgi:hypothetical protein
MVVSQMFSPAKVIFAGIGVLLQVSIPLDLFVGDIVTPGSVRQPRMSTQDKMCSLISSHG